ncbi:chromosome segregation protein Spc25-domain-containing protein [Pavlovales sp. CCMP2436]|nr:chromosome segregation protein Spc25-domain-containing protein [Pavlovales sp. CCMP2436]|mmetsp:Transcript_6428/g.15654  ORF Transcript_6428/g.15654 Transcript_6428/m.15654 type:complete len:233 (-) Transcript_6428:135-833(-)
MSISDAELSAVTAEVDAWASKNVRALDALSEEHRAAIDELEGNSSSLSQQQLELDDALSHRSDAAKQAQRVVAGLVSQLEQLDVEQQQLPAKRAEIERVIDQESQSLASVQRAITEQEATGERRSVELAKGTSMYRKWLGLAFERVGEDRLRLDLKHVDPSSPERSFSFEVYVDAKNIYHVDKCDPPTPGLAQLVAHLNETNNFAEFVRTVRRKFQESVPGREGAPAIVTQP